MKRKESRGNGSLGLDASSCSPSSTEVCPGMYGEANSAFTLNLEPANTRQGIPCHVRSRIVLRKRFFASFSHQISTNEAKMNAA